MPAWHGSNQAMSPHLRKTGNSFAKHIDYTNEPESSCMANRPILVVFPTRSFPNALSSVLIIAAD